MDIRDINTLEYNFSRAKQEADGAYNFARVMLGDEHPITRSAYLLSAAATDQAAFVRDEAEKMRKEIGR